VPAAFNWLPRARLGAGIVLYFYVTTHLTNHAFGLGSLSAMEAGRDIFVGFWRTPPATLVLYGAFSVHIALVLYSVYRRRTLRMPVRETVQILFGLALPPILIFHIVGTRILSSYFGVDDRYAFEIFIIGYELPAVGIAQATVLVLAWVHGTMGMYFWLHLKPWFARWQPLLYAAALTLPLVALLGFFNAVQEVRAAALDPAWVASLRAAVNWPTSDASARTFDIWLAATSIYGALLLLVIGGRGARNMAQRRRGLVTLHYPMGRQVTVAPGTSILEASRLSGIPHASVCGGRGRCSTCRVRINAGLDVCPDPGSDEVRVLTRVGAPAGIRLACQLRPLGDVSLTPLLPPATARPSDGFRQPNYAQGMEGEIAILFADLRAFTTLSQQKLPYDVVFLLNQYFRSMGGAIEGAGGRLDKFIGDGVMALFGVGGDARGGCRSALEAARRMSLALTEMNETLATDLETPLRMGIGIHVGTVIIGEMGYQNVSSLTAIGDAVNTASRLEALSKDYGAQLVFSAVVSEKAGLDLAGFPRRDVEVRGRTEPLSVFVIDDAARLPETARSTH
jgi:adenylate cyclase